LEDKFRDGGKPNNDTLYSFSRPGYRQARRSHPARPGARRGRRAQGDGKKLGELMGMMSTFKPMP
jgi:hypothetical protein